jgi:hypothetical protein
MEEKKKVLREFSILSVVIQETTGQKGVCKRIVFTTDVGRITFSPKDMKISQRVNKDGLTVESVERENMLIADLPEILSTINNKINDDGSCKVKAQYTEWKTVDQQAEPVTYLFFSSIEDFKAIKILE